MSDPKGDRASNVPSSSSDSREMDPGVQASMPGTEGATEQTTSVARSRPKRAAAAAAASSIQQFGAPRQNREVTRTTSRKANEANDEDPNVTLYNRDGTVWEPRPISKIIQDFLNPRQEPLPAHSETKGVPLQAITTDNKKPNSHVPVSTETELVAVPLPPEISVTVQPLTLVVDAASSNSYKKTRSRNSTTTLDTPSLKPLKQIVIIINKPPSLKPLKKKVIIINKPPSLKPLKQIVIIINKPLSLKPLKQKVIIINKPPSLKALKKKVIIINKPPSLKPLKKKVIIINKPPSLKPLKQKVIIINKPPSLKPLVQKVLIINKPPSLKLLVQKEIIINKPPSLPIPKPKHYLWL
jgi:hypothetical protein